jgi:hypothetical protein
MTRGKCSIVALALILSIWEGKSQPLSNSGCACKSGCDKSWLRSNIPWCYVDKGCKSTGWDACHDTQKLYNMAVKGKEEAEQQRLQERMKREDAEKNGVELRVQLEETKAHLTDSEFMVASLKHKMAEEAVKAEQKEKADIQRVADKAALDAKEGEQKLAQAQQSLGKYQDTDAKLEQKLKQALTKVSQVEERKREAEKKRAQAEDSEHVAEAKIKTTEQKLRQVEDVEKKAEEQNKLVERDLVQVKSEERKEEMKVQETERKLQQELLKESDIEKKLRESEAERKADDVKLHDLNSQLSDEHSKEVETEKRLEKRLEDTDAKLKHSMSDLVRLKAVEKEEMLSARRNQTAMLEKLAMSDVLVKTFETELKDAEAKRLHDKKELQEAEKRTKAAEVNANIYKVYVDAKVYKKATLRGMQSPPTPKPKPEAKVFKWLRESQMVAARHLSGPERTQK